MTKNQKVVLFLIRISLGIMYFYAGITKVLASDWSAAGFLKNANSLSGFYEWLSSPSVLPIINFTNEWGLTLLGVSLLLGLFVRCSTILGSILMILYYIPILHFPYVGQNSFLIDQHIIFILCLILLNLFRAGNIWGLDSVCEKKNYFSFLKTDK